LNGGASGEFANQFWRIAQKEKTASAAFHKLPGGTIDLPIMLSGAGLKVVHQSRSCPWFYAWNGASSR
jgi:hypothetical protein